MKEGDRFLYGWLASIMALVALGALLALGASTVPTWATALVALGALVVGGASGLRYFHPHCA